MLEMQYHLPLTTLILIFRGKNNSNLKLKLKHKQDQVFREKEYHKMVWEKIKHYQIKRD